MGYATARQNFENAKSADNDAIRQIAEGLVQLSRAIESDFNKIEREVKDVKSKLR